MQTHTIMMYALTWWPYLMRPSLQNQEIFKLQGKYCIGTLLEVALETPPCKIGLGKLGFECRPPRTTYCVPFNVARIPSASPAVVVIMVFIDLGRSSGQCRLSRTMEGADIVALISILHFLDPALVMVLSAAHFWEMMDVIPAHTDLLHTHIHLIKAVKCTWTCTLDG